MPGKSVYGWCLSVIGGLLRRPKGGKGEVPSEEEETNRMRCARRRRAGLVVLGGGLDGLLDVGEGHDC